jgi:TP901 family phage tail tape measure protein
MTPWRTMSVALQANVAGYVGGLNGASAATKKFAADTDRQLARSQSRWQTFTKAMAFGIAGLAVGLGLSVAEAIKWESAFAGVRKTVNATEAEFKALEDGIVNMANRLPASREEIAGVAEAAGQLGIQTDAILEFSEVMIGLGEATNLGAADAATQLARLANITQMSQADFDRLGSTVVALGNNFATTEAEIVAMSMRIASAGTAIGLTEAEILSIATALSSVGIEAEAGGTAISRIMIDIAKAVDEGGEGLAAFGEAAEMSGEDFAKLFREDSSAAIEAFVAGLGTLDERGKSLFQTLEDLGFADIRVGNALRSLANAGDLLSDSLETGIKAWDENSALADEVAQRYATAESRLAIFANQATNIARIVGAELIPVMFAAIEVLKSFAEWVGRMGAEAVDRLGGAWESLTDTGANLVDLFGALWAASRPLVEILATLAAGVVLGGLIAVADALEHITGFMVDHKEVVILATAAWLGLRGAMLASAAASAVTTGFLTVAAAIESAVVGAGALRAAIGSLAATKGVSTLTASLGVLQSTMGANVAGATILKGALVGIAVGATAATLALNSWHSTGRERAAEWEETLNAGIDRSSIQSMSLAASEAQKYADALWDQADAVNQGGFGYAEQQKLRAEAEAAGKVAASLRQETLDTAKAMQDFGREAGITGAAVEVLAKRAGIDLVDAFDANGVASEELTAEWERGKAVSEQWGTTAVQAAQMTEEELAAVEESLKRVEEAGNTAFAAWSAWSSVLQITDDPVDPDAVKSSEKAIKAARERLAEAEKGSRAEGQTADEAERSAKAVAAARDALKEAVASHQELLDSDSPLNAGKVTDFFDTRITEAEAFTENLNAAIAAGYDPELLSELMQAGPEAAGPVLEALVEDTSKAYVTSINNAREELSAFTIFAVRQAQLTRQAIEIGTRQAAEDLSTAMLLEQQGISNPGEGAVELAVRLGLDPGEVIRIIDDFNLEIEVEADPQKAELEIREFAAREWITNIEAQAEMIAASEGLEGLAAEQRVADIVAWAITSDAEGRLEELGVERKAAIVAEAQTRGAEAALTLVSRPRDIKITPIVDKKGQAIIDALSLGATLSGASGTYGQRRGGLTSYAAGGIHGLSAHIGRGDLIRYAEPETGGEAYVPRRSPTPWRSLSVLSEAAGWFGMGITPMARGGVAGGTRMPPRQPLVVQTQGLSPADIKALAEAIGGPSVHVDARGSGMDPDRVAQRVADKVMGFT